MRSALALAMVISCGPSLAVPPAPSTTASRCQAAHDRTLAAATTAKLDADDVERVVRQLDQCWDGWAVSLDTLCTVSDLHFDNTDEIVRALGRWMITFTASDASAAAYSPHAHVSVDSCLDSGEPGNIAAAELSRLADVETPGTFDYDGDGIPELFVAYTSPTITAHPDPDGLSLRRARTALLLTFKRKVIAEYRIAADGVALGELDAQKDVDLDGRPDLLLRFHTAVPPSVPRRVAHSLSDGRFSLSDAVATAGLLDQCAPTRELLVERADRTLDIAASQAAVACAALRGELGRDISRRLATLCAGRDDCHEVERWANDMYLYGVGKQ
jgi:hypothetical protein